MKKEKRKLKTAEDILRMKWSKILKTANKYGNGHQTKSYPKRKLLPEFDEEAIEPSQSKNKEAAWPDRRPDDRPKATSGAAHKPTYDPGKMDGPTRSIYGPKRGPQEVTQHDKCSKTAAHPNTGAPHTRYVLPMRCWIMNFQQGSNP